MDVRCERCRAHYVFDDEQVTPSGLTVQCTNCGHVFRVKKKELVVTVPVKPDELQGTPLPATSAAPRPGSHLDPPAAPAEAEREWRVRQVGGGVFPFRELTTLQKWIVEQKVSRDDELSQGGDHWRRLGDIAELASFFQVVEAADRARARPPAFPPPGSMGSRSPPAGAPPPPPSGFPPPSFAVPPPPAAPPPPRPRPAAEPAWARGPAPLPVPAAASELGPEERAVVRGSRRRSALALVLLAVAGGAAAWALGAFERRKPADEAVPITIEVPPAPPPAPAPEPAPEPPVAAPRLVEPPPAPPPAPAPAVEPPPKPQEPRGPKAMLALAARLREKGQTQRALDLYGRVASDQPDNVEALVGRGLCYLDLSEYPPAEASFEAALQADPGNADALVGLAETYRWQGKKAEAIRYYEKYLAEHPDGEEAAVARNAIQELRNEER
ncbi:MAG TPA: tetratricopeptide repeat protein [Anaeromyxobacter sp.]|nr:tetratricopeptide repeat protein [Anaeromyxobacter sp.]